MHMKMRFYVCTHVNISQLVNKMRSQQACSKLVNKLSQCCYKVVTHNLLTNRELQDDNKLLEQLVTSLLLTYLLKNVFNHAGHTQHICKNTMG